MSHANGFVKQDNRIIAYFEYNGTVDVACGRLYSTYEEMKLNWRGDNDRRCNCGGHSISVTLETDYGSGRAWNGEVCLRCMAIVKGQDPDEELCQSHLHPPDFIAPKYSCPPLLRHDLF